MKAASMRRFAAPVCTRFSGDAHVSAFASAHHHLHPSRRYRLPQRWRDAGWLPRWTILRIDFEVMEDIIPKNSIRGSRGSLRASFASSRLRYGHEAAASMKDLQDMICIAAALDTYTSLLCDPRPPRGWFSLVAYRHVLPVATDCLGLVLRIDPD